MSGYFNTTNLTGEALRVAIAACDRQEFNILKLYREHGQLTPSRVHTLYAYFCQYPDGLPPLTSIRRAITNLTAVKLLVKGKEMKLGAFGKREHVWQIHDFTSSPTGPVGDSPTPPPAPARSISVGASADAPALVTLAGNVAEAGALAVDFSSVHAPADGSLSGLILPAPIAREGAPARNHYPIVGGNPAFKEDSRGGRDLFPKLLRKTEGAGVE